MNLSELEERLFKRMPEKDARSLYHYVECDIPSDVNIEFLDEIDAITLEFYCEEFHDCEDCEDSVTYRCDAECDHFDECSSTCHRCSNYIEEDNCEDCEYQCSDNNGLDTDCNFRDYCDKGNVSHDFESKDLNIKNIIVVAGDSLYYICDTCGEAISVNKSCDETFTAFLSAYISEIQMRFVCSNCMDSVRMCKKVHIEKERAKIDCWTSGDLKNEH